MNSTVLEFICSVCLQHFNISKRPMVLYCGHTFCSVCIKNLNNCPTCRNPIENGPFGLNKDFETFLKTQNKQYNSIDGNYCTFHFLKIFFLLKFLLKDQYLTIDLIIQMCRSQMESSPDELDFELS